MASAAHLDARTIEETARRAGGLFTSERLAVLIGTNALGAALAVAAWWAASGSDSPSDQFAWLNLSIIGLIVSGTANGIWLARTRRTVVLARKTVLVGYESRPITHRTRSGFIRGLAIQPRPSTVTASRAGSTAHSQHVVAVENGTRFHRVGCPLVNDKPVRVLDRGEASATHIACELCEP